MVIVGLLHPESPWGEVFVLGGPAVHFDLHPSVMVIYTKRRFTNELLALEFTSACCNFRIVLEGMSVGAEHQGGEEQEDELETTRGVECYRICDGGLLTLRLKYIFECTVVARSVTRQTNCKIFYLYRRRLAPLKSNILLEYS